MWSPQRNHQSPLVTGERGETQRTTSPSRDRLRREERAAEALEEAVLLARRREPELFGHRRVAFRELGLALALELGERLHARAMNGRARVGIEPRFEPLG